ncbi:MAG: deoxynucleoside kinase [Pseudomonadota bacterium]
MLPDKYRYIVVEGPIGAGKTTLAHKLAEYLGAETLFEEPARNPFLPQFYRDMARHALPTQLFFLFQRAEQAQALQQADLFKRITVADFMLDKDPLFARLNLNDDEFHLYQQIYDHLQLQARRPDLVIYLQASTDVLLERVHKRGHAYERPISEDYLARLAATYTRFFYQYEAAPVLIVNSENLNFVDREDDFALLLQRIAGLRGQREFFSLGN